MPGDVKAALCRGLHDANRFEETTFELIVGRTLQELGATALVYEPLQSSGKRPDYLATFTEGAVFVDARHPDWNAQLQAQRRGQERLLQIIEEEIPAGWSFTTTRLPRLGLSDRLAPFRAVIRRAFADLPTPTAGMRVPIMREGPDLPFKLELHAPRIESWRAWMAGPATAAFTAPEQRILTALSDKREQLAGVAHPALVALGGTLGASLEDYEIALFGRGVAQVDARGRVVARRFDPSGAFARPGSDREPSIAGVLAFTGMDLTRGREPVLFLHPRFRSHLPDALLALEVRTLTAGGPVTRAASIHGALSRLGQASAGR